jgi:RNA polymerase sigma-70 factor (ECF subfamily)
MSATPETLYEQTLVLRSQLGDEAAFAELLERHGPRLLLFTQRMMQSSPELVADVTQETWVAIYRALPRLQDVAKFRPWAFRIARDRIYREYRRRKLPVQSADDAQLADVPESAELDSGIDREGLQRCLALISPEHREALALRFFEEMSYEDIARATGSSVGTVRSRIHYGKEAFKKAWKGKTT